MGVHLGPAHEAAQALARSEVWPDFMAGLQAVVSNATHAALTATDRVDATGYARGVLDLYQAIESAATGVRVNQLPKLPPRNKGAV